MSDHTPSQHEVQKRLRLIRLPEVMNRVGLKRSAIYQRMSEGRFPRSRSMGTRCTVWVESEIDEWLNSVVVR
jgi:prophage regulatory protein